MLAKGMVGRGMGFPNLSSDQEITLMLSWSSGDLNKPNVSRKSIHLIYGIEEVFSQIHVILSQT